MQLDSAGQWTLIRRRFRRHRLGMVGGIVAVLFYLIAACGEFLVPHDADSYSAPHTYAPPQAIRLFQERADGRRVIRPHVMGTTSTIDYDSGRRTFEDNPEDLIDLGLFVQGHRYRLLGVIPASRHLIGPVDPAKRVYLLGADRLGRDVLSRTILATRISMTIGLLGVALALVLGVALGGISGFFGGWTDALIQRLIEFLQSLPSIPLWIGLAAAIPPTSPPVRTYFLITVILSVLGWTGLARVVRGRFLALKNEDFVRAARLDGLRDRPHPRAAHGAQLPEPHHRGRHAGDSGHDRGRNVAQLPRHRLAPAGGELGRAAPGGAEHPLDRGGAVVVHPQRGGSGSGIGTQLSGRWTA